MQSIKFLDQLIREQNLKNDFTAAKKLGWASSKISQYRTGKRIMDNEACIALALELGVDPMKVIMAADIDRAERAGQKSLWEVFTARMATAASVILVVNLFLTPGKSEAAPRLTLQGSEQPSNLYYVQSLRKLRAVRTALKRWFLALALQPTAR